MQGHNELPQLLSVEELAGLLQVAVRTIYDWRYRGLGPTPVRMGGRLRFDPDDVARWIAARKGFGGHHSVAAGHR